MCANRKTGIPKEKGEYCGDDLRFIGETREKEINGMMKLDKPTGYQKRQKEPGDIDTSPTWVIKGTTRIQRED